LGNPPTSLHANKCIADGKGSDARERPSGRRRSGPRSVGRVSCSLPTLSPTHHGRHFPFFSSPAHAAYRQLPKNIRVYRQGTALDAGGLFSR
jgi:hypothetical protein